MAKVHSNLAEITALCGELANLIDFTEPGEDKSLGQDCLDVIASGCSERAIQDQRGAEERWADNAPKYAKSKRKAGKPVGVLTGDMLSDVQMEGERTVMAQEAVMRYGTDDDDDARNKASWFSRGSAGAGDGQYSGAKNQPARPGMYEMDDQIEDDVAEVIAEHVDRKLDRLRRGAS